jgi:hypothetical protein
MDAKNDAWRHGPATEQQKEKLLWFGCTWKGAITVGHAHDALEECAKSFPDRDAAYYRRPATEEQFNILQPYFEKYGEEPGDHAEGDYLTYGEAMELIQVYETTAPRGKMGSCGPDDHLRQANYFRVTCNWPEVTLDQFDKVWTLAKSRLANQSSEPQPHGIIAALHELFPELFPANRNRQ